MRNCSIENQ